MTRSTDAQALPALEIETAPQPTHAVIWLHGLGADGHDFEPVVDMFDAGRLPPTRFVFPHAPMRAVTINGGYVMRAWYDVLSTDFASRREDGAGVLQSAAQIEVLLERESRRGVAARNIVLAGFSQGGAIALHTGLRHGRRLAGIAALSTYLPLADTLAQEAAAVNRDVPVFMAHGRYDEIIPYALGEACSDSLRALGYTVEWRGYAADHGVSIEELRDIETWLRRVLG